MEKFELNAEEKALIRGKHRIRAIKALRDRTGLALAEARKLVEDWEEEERVAHLITAYPLKLREQCAIDRGDLADVLPEFCTRTWLIREDALSVIRAYMESRQAPSHYPELNKEERLLVSEGKRFDACKRYESRVGCRPWAAIVRVYRYVETLQPALDVVS